MEEYKRDSLSPKELGEMEERRISKLDEAGIDEKEVLHNANQNLNIWQNYFNENITRGKDDMNFVLRDQWTAVERSEFTRLFKPAMTFNKLYDSTKKIAGEQRKNKPDLIVRSLTGKATQEQINLRADLVRTISYQSQNDLVYQTAFRSALMMGFGAFEIDIDYEHPKSFNQVIRFNLIPDPIRTAFDPAALKPHKADGNYTGRSYLFSKEEFAATYPYVINPVSYMDPRSLLDFQWETRDSILVCDYAVKEWFPVILYKLSNGQTVTKEEWEDMQEQFSIYKSLAKEAQVVGGMILDEIPKIIMERQSQDYKIMKYRLIKDQIIDFSEWPSKHLPHIFVDGDSYFVEGRQYTKSFIHEARDAQKFINFVGSEIAAEIKNRRREQWLGTPDNIIGNEQQWRNPELQMGILIAKPDPKTGMMPTKQQPWDLSPALMANFQRGTQDIKEILGFSESEELQGRDISGKARRERKIEGSMAAYVFFDNLNQAIEQAGRLVLDLLPAVYGNDERHMIISKSDGQTKSIILNKKLENGTQINALEAGEYDVEIDTGPSFAVQKDIALEFLQQTLQAYPQAFPLIADLWAKNLDVQFMPQMAERFKTLVPPQILAKEEDKPAPPPQPDPQQQMMQQEMQMKMQDIQMRQQKQQLDQAKLQLDAQKLMEDIRSSQTSDQIDRQKLMVETQKIMSDIEIARADHHLQNKKVDLDHFHKMNQLHMNNRNMQNASP